MDWLDDIFKRFDLIFWIIIGVGTAVASALKKKKTDAAGKAVRRRQAAERAAREAPQRAATAAPPAQPKPRNPLEQAMAEFERLFGLEEEQAAAGGRARGPAAPRPVVPAAPAAAPGMVAGELPLGLDPNMQGLATPLKDLETFRGADMPVFESSDLGRAMDSGLGSLQTTGLDVLVEDTAILGRREPWKVTGNWRDAVILREILGSPRAFAANDIPGLQGLEG